MNSFLIIGIFLGSALTAFAGPYPPCTSQSECNSSNDEICTTIFSNDRGTYCVNRILAMTTMHGENPDRSLTSNGSLPCFPSMPERTTAAPTGYSLTRKDITPQNAAVRGFRMPSGETQSTIDKEIKKQEKACNNGFQTACACLAKNKRGVGFFLYSKSWLWGETCTPVAF